MQSSAKDCAAITVDNKEYANSAPAPVAAASMSPKGECHRDDKTTTAVSSSPCFMTKAILLGDYHFDYIIDNVPNDPASRNTKLKKENGSS